MTDQSETIQALQLKLAEREAEYHRSEKIQTALYEIADAASAVTDMHEFYVKLHGIITGLMYAKNLFIATLDEETGMMSWPYHVDEVDMKDSFWAPVPLREEKGATSYVMRTGNVMHTASDSAALIQSGEFEVIGALPEDAIFVPLQAGGRNLGALGIQSYTKGIGYTAGDVQVLTFVAQHISTALSRARALQETLQRNNELAILNSVGEAMAKSLDIKTVTRIVGDKVRDIFNSDGVSIMLLDAQSNLIHTLYEYDKGEGGYLDYIKPFALGTGLTTEVIQSRQSLLLGTLEEQGVHGGYLAPESVEQGSGVVAESWLGVPIIVGDKVLGIVSITNYRAGAFGDSHRRLLQTLSSNMGVAIENARLFEAEQQRIAELQIINSIQQGLASKLELQAIIDLVGDKLREVLRTEEIGIRLYDEQTGLVHYLYEYEHGERLTIPPMKPSALFYEVQQHRLPVFGKTLEISRKYGLINVPGTEVSKSMATVPILAGNKVIGGIAVENYEREDAFNESNVRLMQTIASSMGVALENARLFDETQRLFKAEQQRAAELAIVTSVQDGLASKLDMRAIYDLVGDKIREVFDAQVVSIMTYDRSTDLLTDRYAFEKDDRTLVPGSMPSYGFRKHVIQTRTPLLINRDTEKAHIEYDNPILYGAMSKSNIFVPMIAGSDVTGVVSVQNLDHEDAFTDSDVGLLQTLANSMSVALENARLFDEVQKNNREISEALEQQKGTGEILRVIAGSPTDIQPVLVAVAEHAARLCQANDVQIYRLDGNSLRQVTHFGPLPALQDGESLPLVPGLVTGRAVLERRTIHVEDMRELSKSEYPESVLLQERLGHRTAVSTPLLREGKAIGAIVVRRNEVSPFTGKQIALLSTFADQAAIAIENVRLFNETTRLLKETEQRAAELSVINSVQQGLASKLNMQAIYDLVGDRIREIFGTEVVYIAIRNANHPDQIDFPYYVDRGRRLPLETYPLGQGITSRVIEAGQPVVAGTMQKQLELGGIYQDGEQSQSYLGVPILLGDTVKGVASVQSYQVNAFGDADIRLLSTLAASMGVALENARLFDETQRLLTETEQRAAELAIINSVQEGLASKLEMPAIYALVGDKVRETFSADTTYIVTYDAPQQLVYSHYYVERGHHVAPQSLPYGRGLYSQVLSSRQPILVGTLAQARKLGATDVPSPAGEGDLNQSGMYVPITLGDDVMGVVSVQSYKENAYRDGDVHLLTTLANSMSVALENARLFDETQRLLKETEQRNAELAVINSVQGALAAKLDIQAIYDAVGGKVSQIFRNADVGIRIYDPVTNLIHFPYTFEDGKRIEIDPIGRGNAGITNHVLNTQAPLMINQNAEEESAKLGSYTIPGTQGEKSALYVPLVVGEQARGLISLIDLQRENAFADSDVRLLSTVANSMSVALENARLFDETQRLLKETEHRAAELAIINSVQEGLASKLDIEAIYDLVGEKIRDIFDAQSIIMATFDHRQRTRHFTYNWEKGTRYPGGDLPFNKLTEILIQTRQPVVIEAGTLEEFASFGMVQTSGTDVTKSGVWMPLLAAGQVSGMVSLQNVDREHAFSESDVRLLQTLTSSMGVALENARLFDETQRLLKETEQRAAELAIINSVQEGLASKLDMQAIYDLVGEKIRQVFDAQSILIDVFDHERQTDRIMYGFESGQRVYDDAEQPFNSLVRRLVSTRQPVTINENATEVSRQYGMTTVPGTQSPKSLIFVPFGTAAQVNGHFSLQNIDREHAFSESDVRLLQTLAGSMGIALENARLFKAEQQRAAELSAISAVSQALVAETDLDKMIELIGEKMRDTFSADIAYVALLDRTTNLINFPYAYGDEFPALKYGEGLTSRILQTGEPLLINRDIEKRRAELGTQRIGKQAASYLGVPVTAGRQSIGVISVQSISQENAFGEDDLRLLSTIAANAGAAIRTAQLHTETQRRAQEMAILAEIGNDIAASRELEPVLERIAQHAKNILNVRDIAINLKESDGQTFRTAVALGTNVLEMKSMVITLGQGITGHILQSGIAEFVNHPTKDSRRLHVPGTPEDEDERECMMGAPLTSRGETIGGIMVWRERSDGLFTEAELDFLVSVARQTAIAIESARLYLETQRRANEMSALAEVGREISSSLEPAVVLEKIAARARELLAASSSAVFLLNPDKNAMQAITALGELEHEIKADAIRLGEGIIGSLALDGRAEFVNDTSTDPRAIQIPGTQEIQQENLMVAPLFRGNEVTGMMAVWRTVDPFNEADLNFLVGLSRQAAIALENARLFEEIKRQGQYLETIFSNSPVAIVTVDETGQVLSWSPAAEKLFGYTREEALGRNVDDLVASSPDIHKEASSYTLHGMDNQYVHRITKRTRKDGSLVDVDLSALPLPLEGGKTGVVAIYNDVGEIQRQRQYYEAIVQNSPVAIVAMDEESNVVSWNPGAEQLFGYKRGEAIGRNIDEMVATTPELLSQARHYNAQAISQELHVITRRTRKDHSEVEVELSGVPLPLPTGKSGLVAIYHDITELQRARQEAITANEAKSAFLATMSHEIRTPMNAVIGMSGLLMDTQLTKEQHDYAETIRNSGDALLAIINDILDFSKIEAGKMDLERQPFDLRECVESALDLVAGRAVEKNLDLAYIIDDDVPVGIGGDVTRLRQILLNLMSNAVKFTARGEVVLTVKRDKAPGRLLFAVRDSGIGIAPDRMGRLFESFSQADSSTTRRFGGTGLGLAISKRLAELMGGAMWAESPGAGKGSTFSFSIAAEPAKVAERKTNRDVKGIQPALQGRRVLIVDDNATNRRILMLQTDKWGMAPRETQSPREALKWLKSGDAFDLVILDVQMPEMDGIMLARELRRLKDRVSLPIILLTSLGRKEAGAEDLSIAAYLTKPLKPSALFDALAGIFARNLITPRAEPAKAVLDSEMAGNHPLRILLAEDNAVNQKLALRLLQQMGYRADVASNGLEAVESVQRQSYDVVLMDVQMPEMDGLDATRAIRKLKTIWQPRVVAMTANAMQGDREMCIAAGMDDYISKPIRVAELVEALTKTESGKRIPGKPAGKVAKKPAKKKAASSRTAKKVVAKKRSGGSAVRTARKTVGTGRGSSEERKSRRRS